MKIEWASFGVSAEALGNNKTVLEWSIEKLRIAWLKLKKIQSGLDCDGEDEIVALQNRARTIITFGHMMLSHLGYAADLEDGSPFNNSIVD